MPTRRNIINENLSIEKVRELIESSEVIEIESDAVPFSHKLLEN